MLQHFSELIDKVKAMPRTVVCVANADSETVEAARMALDKGLADVILYGDEAVVRPLVEQAGIEGRAELRHAADPATALREAVRSVRGGESGVLMKGMLNSSDFLRGVLNKEEGLRTGRRLSHIAAVELPGYHKLIYSTDGGMNINPDLAAKKDILANALLALRSWGYECPKVACLAANERVDPHNPATIDAAGLVEAWERGEFLTQCIVEGPIAMDVALNRESALHKGMKAGFPATPIFSSCRSWKWATAIKGLCLLRAVRWPGSSSGQPRRGHDFALGAAVRQTVCHRVGMLAARNAYCL
ncbi:MAG: phosphate acyltransferase [Bilophila wadsworthia]